MLLHLPAGHTEDTNPTQLVNPEIPTCVAASVSQAQNATKAYTVCGLLNFREFMFLK